MKTQPVWHGTSEQALELSNAIMHNCACQPDNQAAPGAWCAAHAMLEDQRTLDGLAFGRYMATRLVAQEFTVAQPVSAPQA